MGLLSLLLCLPLAGVIGIALLPAGRVQLARPLALLASAAALFLSWGLLFRFSPSADLQFVEYLNWHSQPGTTFHLGVDGISFPMILLATLLCFIALLASKAGQFQRRAYYILMLLLESAMLGVFMARNWSLFYVFWELTLLPLFFLIDRWGGARRNQAALNFVLYTMGGSVFMLISLLLVFDNTPGHSFAMDEMMTVARNLPAQTQVLIFLGFVLGFGVKMPIFPLHGWLPLAHVEAPAPVSILLSGILLKMGAYGLILAAGMLPLAVRELQSLLMALALFSLIYGGLLAWRQSDMKKMIAYSSISHMGIVLLGIATLNVIGLTGALMQMVAHGLVAGALFLLIGLLYERTGKRDINDYSSLIQVMPRFAFFTSIALLAGMGIPGTVGFVSELHVLIGGFERWGWWMLLVSISVMITAAWSVRTLSRLFTGPVRNEMHDIGDLQAGELVAAAMLIGGIVLMGMFPAPVLNLMAASVQELGDLFVPGGMP